MHAFLSNPSFNAQFVRTLGHCVHGGADLGECLSLLPKLKQECIEAWYQSWMDLANRVASQARTYEGKHPESAYSAYLRASNYYRTAYFFLDEYPQDPRIKKAHDACVKTFFLSLDNSNIDFQVLEIAYEDTTMPAYLYIPKRSKNNKPLLIDTGGGDGLKEEAFFTTALPAIKRGYYCLNFDGPGQGEMLRRHGIGFRPDWEVVIKAVVDALIEHPAINAKQIYLTGTSFGGYLASRAASHEHRLAGCIADPGILNSVGSTLKKLPLDVVRAIEKNDESTVDNYCRSLKDTNRWGYYMLESRKVRFSARSIFDMLQKTQDYHLQNSVQNIKCPMLIIDNDKEHITPGQALRLFDALQCPKTYHLFKDDDGNGGHCQPMSRLSTTELIFNWLDECTKA